MSHYTVAVITKTDDITELEELLAPFDENIEVEEYVYRTKQQIIDDVKNRKEEYLAKIKKASKQELRDFLTDRKYHYMRNILNLYSDDDFYNFEHYDDCSYNKNGDELSTYNPNSKWDWYSIGGRWSGELKKKNSNEYFNTLQVKDWDTTPDEETINAHKRFWELAVEHQEPTEDEKPFFSLYNENYYIEKYKTKENYANIASEFQTYAVLMPDGTWLEPGKMGWWGVSHSTIDEALSWEENYKTNIIDKLDPEWYITIVDCHI